MMKKLIFITIVCMFVTSPAMADLFGFHFGNLSSTYNSATNLFSSGDWAQTTGSLYRNIAPAGTASFNAGSWNIGGTLEDLLIQMTISNINSSTADGVGTITLKDIQGDTLAANVSGTWQKGLGLPTFVGTLSSVTYAPANNTFDGHSGDSVSLVFAGVPQSTWWGAIVQLTSYGSWFTNGTYTDVKSGSIDATVIPTPAAVLLGILGFCVAGWKLRKFA